MSQFFIGTYTNKHFNFLNPHVDEVCIEDIAQALSMNCRYNGHVKSFYSVAEHCCIISDMIDRETGDSLEALSALLHDASEAYLTDIPRPIKPHLGGYMEMEAKAERVIQQKFGISPMSKRVKYIDTHICRAEAEILFKIKPSWVDAYEHMDIKIMSYPPAEAKNQFLRRFFRLQKEVINDTKHNK